MVSKGDGLRNELRLPKDQVRDLKSESKAIDHGQNKFYLYAIRASDILKTEQSKLLATVRQIEADRSILNYKSQRLSL